MTSLPVGLALIALSLGLAGSPASDARAMEVGCYKITAKAIKMADGYKHEVTVDNQCEYWLQCEVWTNVNPTPAISVTIGPKASESAQTAVGSSTDEVTGYGSCRRK